MENIAWDIVILPAWKTVKEYACFKSIPRWKMLKRAYDLNKKG